ncbi:MAG: hypothetical protein N3E42_00705 [Candidatus Bipolaricaulota bacterium]|nr:hypothetical protein [Candidatus Bipolaricaulota bacterium]
MRALTVLVVCAGLWGVCVPTAWAQPRSSDFFMEEFTFGLLGGFIGGPTLELIYVTTLCREAPNPDLCQGFGFAAMQVVIYTVTLPAGASAGIILAGLWRGIPSDPLDWVLTYLFATAGSLTGWLNAAGVIKVSEFLMETFGWDLSASLADIYTITRVFLPILYAAFFGTLQFNLLTQPAPAPPAAALSSPAAWEFPIFTMRF